jgi:membrane-associated protease RseP (regulator of RpoE activity)
VHIIYKEKFMDIVSLIHSLVRFVILAIALVGIVKAVLSLAQKSALDKLDQTLAAAFLGLYDLQVLVGLLIILLGGLTNVIHPIVMFVGVALAHGLQAMSKRAAGANASLYRLAFYVAPLLVILVGLAAISHLPV